MEHSITSDGAGVVEEMRVSEGDQVDVGMLLAVIAGADGEDEA